MKMKLGLIWAVALFTGLATVLAEDTPPALTVPGASNTAPATTPAPAPAPADTTAVPTPAPADTSTNKPTAKKSTKKKDTTKKTVEKKKPAEPAGPPLIANEPAVSKQNKVNVR